MIKLIFMLPTLALSAMITSTSAFADYVAKFGKTYSTTEEYLLREQIFLANDAYIREHNAQGHDWGLGHN